MADCSTTGIMLRRTAYGDYDLIITFLTAEYGKTVVMAKSARKSVRRFNGFLEPLSTYRIEYKTGRGKLPFLLGAELKHPFPAIRSHIQKAAYANYWAEVINEWLEEGHIQNELFSLFSEVLNSLNESRLSPEMLSIFFQIKMMVLAGIAPDLTHCRICGKQIISRLHEQSAADVKNGGLLCRVCSENLPCRAISGDTAASLIRISKGNINNAGNISLPIQNLREGLWFSEAFVCCHLVKYPKSLSFLRQIRGFE